MAIDAAALAQLAAKFMDDLENEYGPEAELVDAVIAVEITTGEDDFVEHRSIEERSTSEIGILTLALGGSDEDE